MIIFTLVYIFDFSWPVSHHACCVYNYAHNHQRQSLHVVLCLLFVFQSHTRRQRQRQQLLVVTARPPTKLHFVIHNITILNFGRHSTVASPVVSRPDLQRKQLVSDYALCYKSCCCIVHVTSRLFDSRGRYDI